MQIVCLGDNLNDMSKPIVWAKEEKNMFNLWSAEIAQRMIKVNGISQNASDKWSVEMKRTYRKKYVLIYLGLSYAIL